jgi:hypothetical protein
MSLGVTPLRHAPRARIQAGVPETGKPPLESHVPRRIAVLSADDSRHALLLEKQLTALAALIRSHQEEDSQ